MSQNKYHVLVTYMEAGMGHIISADAIADALETYYPDEVEVERSHIFTETEDPVLEAHERQFVRQVTYAQRHRSHFFILTFLQNILPPLDSLKLSYNIAYPRVKKHLQDIMLKKNPDMVFCTHWTPLHAAVEAKAHRKADFLTGLYVPDPNVHGWWDRRADLCLVNNQCAYDDAIREGFKPEQLVLSKFILRSNVRSATKDKAELRRRHDLPLDNFTVVLADGAYASANMCPFADEFLKIDRPFTMLVICGSNEKVYRHYAAMVGHTGKIDLRVYRFVPDAHELYGASDLFVTKAGPNALLDAVWMDTPVMTNYYSSPIERITNRLYIDEHHVGTYTGDPAEGARQLVAYMDDPATLEPYRENCRAFVRDCVGGEKEMADAIVKKLRENGPPRQR